MAREKTPYCIDKIYKTSYFDAVTFGFLSACTSMGISNVDAVFRLHDLFGLDEDTAPVTAVLRTYRRNVREHNRKMGTEFQLPDSDYEQNELLNAISKLIENAGGK